MENNLGLLEEFDAERRLRTPHLLYSKKSTFANKNIAFVVLAKKDDEILLVNANGFEDSAVVAGLTERHCEQLAKYAPREHKEYLFGAVQDEYFRSDVLEIAKEMDEDLDNKSDANIKRVEKVLQYISDNRSVFQF